MYLGRNLKTIFVKAQNQNFHKKTVYFSKKCLFSDFLNNFPRATHQKCKPSKSKLGCSNKIIQLMMPTCIFGLLRNLDEIKENRLKENAENQILLIAFEWRQSACPWTPTVCPTCPPIRFLSNRDPGGTDRTFSLIFPLDHF